MTKVDTHVHSKYSFDSKMKISEIIKEAEKHKLDFITITDHVEFANQPVKEVIHRITNRNKKIDELQETTKVKLLKSVEISEPHLYLDEVERINDIEDLDSIIGSIHHILGMPMRKMSDNPKASYLYLKSLYYMIDSADIDQVAHLDYLKRYLQSPNFDEDLLKEILSMIIDKKLALEINSSGIRRCGSPFPGYEIVDVYSDLGGRRVCYGSDAHEPNEIYDGIDEVQENLSDKSLNDGVIIKRRFRSI